MREKDPMLRFMLKVEKTNYCWNYTGHNDNGYGRFWYKGKGTLAHRWIYENQVGAIPKGMQIDHLCNNRRCVNIKHLEVVDNKEQQKRRSLKQTHCKNGHEFTYNNVYLYNNKRNCRKCINIRNIKYMERTSS